MVQVTSSFGWAKELETELTPHLEFLVNQESIASGERYNQKKYLECIR
jgi:hypothetical protein